MRARIIASGAGVALALAAAPAAAQYRYHPAQAYPLPAHRAAYAPPVQAAFPVDRALAERCGFRAGSVRPHWLPAAYHDGYDYRGRDDGLGGALIGGVVGGVAGNRIAGRGDRTVGTVAGAAVGAVAGAAIDRAEDDRGPEPRYAYDSGPGVDYADECDALLPPGYMLVSVPGGVECRDEVVTREEWVPETVTVPGPPRRAAPLRDKRTKLRRVN
ncbi:MAG: glycine zipper 2TM domain-containing protein [Novosphingobium sp.]|nr:glycine zipper 2TM domain-containing protein [Novosphingobium sp.]